MRIQNIEGVGPAYAKTLVGAGIKTTDDLLKHCANPKGRKSVADQTGLSESNLLRWTNMADLMRINGIGSQYAELLENAGVDTVKELRTRNVENLATKMKEVNDQKKLTRKAPSASLVTEWVKQASTLDAKISY